MGKADILPAMSKWFRKHIDGSDVSLFLVTLSISLLAVILYIFPFPRSVATKAMNGLNGLIMITQTADLLFGGCLIFLSLIIVTRAIIHRKLLANVSTVQMEGLLKIIEAVVHKKYLAKASVAYMTAISSALIVLVAVGIALWSAVLLSLLPATVSLEGELTSPQKVAWRMPILIAIFLAGAAFLKNSTNWLQRWLSEESALYSYVAGSIASFLFGIIFLFIEPIFAWIDRTF